MACRLHQRGRHPAREQLAVARHLIIYTSILHTISVIHNDVCPVVSLNCVRASYTSVAVLLFHQFMDQFYVSRDTDSGLTTPTSHVGPISATARFEYVALVVPAASSNSRLRGPQHNHDEPAMDQKAPRDIFMAPKPLSSQSIPLLQGRVVDWNVLLPTRFAAVLLELRHLHLHLRSCHGQAGRAHMARRSQNLRPGASRAQRGRGPTHTRSCCPRALRKSAAPGARPASLMCGGTTRCVWQQSLEHKLLSATHCEMAHAPHAPPKGDICPWSLDRACKHLIRAGARGSGACSASPSPFRGRSRTALGQRAAETGAWRYSAGAHARLHARAEDTPR